MRDAEYFKKCTEANERRLYTDGEGVVRYEEKMHEFGCPILKQWVVLTHQQSDEYFDWIKEYKAPEPNPKPGVVQAISGFFRNRRIVKRSLQR